MINLTDIPSVHETFPNHNKPQIMQYIEFSDKSHNDLLRCSECNIKFGTHELSRIGVGKFVCRFCMNVGA